MKPAEAKHCHRWRWYDLLRQKLLAKAMASLTPRNGTAPGSVSAQRFGADRTRAFKAYWRIGIVAAAFTATGLDAAAAAAAPACADLMHIAISGGRIDSAVPMKPGDTVPLIGMAPSAPVTAALCRVQGVLTPTRSSNIKFEVWLPEPGAWNGKFVGTGNGGFGGNLTVPYVFMLTAVPKGYAAAGSDLGHSGTAFNGDWALNNPEKVKDYAWRSNHLTAIAAKAVIAAYYGSMPSRAYFQGCSDGGREALMEARRFPLDYEGIIAGAPGNATTRLATAHAWDELAVHGRPESIIPVSKLPVIQAAAYSQCKALDPLTDGYLDDPRACLFNPAKLRCAAGDGPSCLTDAQVAALRKVYAGPVNPRSGVQIFPGFEAGSEGVSGTWDQWIVGPDAQQGLAARSFLRDIAFNDPTFDLSSFDFDQDFDRLDRSPAADIVADDPDLGAFKARGGRLILYHGWADAAIPPQATVNYYKAIQAKFGERSAAEFVRLFMVPGMAHCLTGPGPNTFDALAALDHWTDLGAAPESVVAKKYQNDLLAYIGLPSGPALKSRPLCAYPKVARWTGRGSTAETANFTCEAPRPSP